MESLVTINAIQGKSNTQEKRLVSVTEALLKTVKTADLDPAIEKKAEAAVHRVLQLVTPSCSGTADSKKTAGPNKKITPQLRFTSSRKTGMRTTPRMTKPSYEERKDIASSLLGQPQVHHGFDHTYV